MTIFISIFHINYIDYIKLILWKKHQELIYIFYRIRCHKSASYSGAISRSETYKL
jgi:hypothetical protein